MNNDIKEYTTPSGKKRYMFSIYVCKDDSTGQSIQIRKRGYKSLQDAQKAYLNYQQDILNGEYNPNVNAHIKLNKLIDDWLPVYEPTVKESTYATTLRIIDNHIRKELGNYYLDKLNIRLCDKAVKKWFKNSPKVFKRYAMYTSKILDYAISLELIKTNPMKKVILPKPKKDKKEFDAFYSKQELEDFLFWAKDYSFKAYAVFRLLAYSGMRIGELMALRWSDVDLSKDTITIERTYSKGLNNRRFITTPKTVNGFRTIHVEHQTLKVLTEWRKQQTGNLIRLGENVFNANQLVFSNLNNEPLESYTVEKWNKAICNKHHLRHIKLHGFRHTHASLCFEAGLAIGDVKNRLGHASIRTTMDVYTHVTKTKEKESADKFSRFMEM